MKKSTHLVLLLSFWSISTLTQAQITCEFAVGEYTWLADILDANDCCNNQKVYAYPSGIYTFISIQKCIGSGPNELYFQDGTFYCSDQAAGSCLAAYGLSESSRIEVWDCSRPCIGSNVDAGFIICAGEAVFLEAEQRFPTPPQGPVGPEGSFPVRPCTPQLVSIEITPTNNSLAQGTSGFLVNPPETRVYRVRSIGRCGGAIAPGVFEPEHHDTIDVFYEVLIDCPDNGGGNMMTAAIFEDYTWLSDIVNPANCSAESITVYQSGTFEFLYIENGDGTGSLYLGNGTFYCSGTPTYDCVAAYNLSEVITTWTCGDGGTTMPPDNGGGDHSDDPVFSDFPWLSTLFNPANCTNEQVAVYNQGAFQFLLVNDQLYFQDGSFYCQNSDNYDCVSAYNLGAPTYKWNCQTGGSGEGGGVEEPPTNTPDCDKNEGVIVFAPCGEGGETYVFIQTDNGQLYDLYYASGVSYQAINGRRVKFDFVNAEFASPCSNATQAIRVTCIEEIPEPTMTCSTNTGTFFFRNCDDGTRFFFIETTDGRILDPYFDAGVSHNPVQGQTVNFDYVDAGNSPCTIAEKAVSITCLEVVDNVLPAGDCNNNRGEIFFSQCDDGTDYFFIRTTTGQILDPYYAAGISFQEYDGAQIQFDYVVAGFNTPCSIANQAVTITCIKELVPAEVSFDIPDNFENYDVIYRICRGDALRIPNLKREVQCNCPPNPQGPCDNLPFNQWAVWSGGPLVDDISSVTVSPTVTTTYEAEINAFFCGVNGPSLGPAAKTTYLVIVENSTSCNLSNVTQQTTFNINGCPDEIVRVPAPSPSTCPLGPPIEENGVIEVVSISDNFLEVRLLNNGSFTYGIGVEEDPTGVSCPTATYVYNVDVTTCEGNEPQTRVFDYRACAGDKMTLPIPAHTHCSMERIFDNEDIVEVLSMDVSSMEVRLLKSGHVSVSALGNESGCANTSHLFSFVTIPNCGDDGLTETNTGRNKVVVSTNGFLTYPNPTKGMLTVQIAGNENAAQQLIVHDLFGRILETKTLAPTASRQVIDLNLTNYDNGIYYVELRSSGKRQMQRVIKQDLR